MQHFRTETDPVTGVRHDYYWDDEQQRMTIRNRHDVTEILEGNKRQQNDSIDSRYGNQMMHHVADIPMSVVVLWKQRYGVDVLSSEPEHRKRVKQLLNDPEWRYLKTTVKRI